MCILIYKSIYIYLYIISLSLTHSLSLLLLQNRPSGGISVHKERFARPDCNPIESLAKVVHHVKPTAIVGLHYF